MNFKLISFVSVLLILVGCGEDRQISDSALNNDEIASEQKFTDSSWDGTMPTNPSPESKSENQEVTELSAFNEACHVDNDCEEGLSCTCDDSDNCTWGRCRVSCDADLWPKTQCPANYICASNFCYTKDELSKVIGAAVDSVLPKKKPVQNSPKPQPRSVVEDPSVEAPDNKPVVPVVVEEVPQNIQKIFSAKCAGCHNPQGVAAGTGLFLTDAETSFDRLVEVQAKGNPSLDRVSPGDPNNSVLVKRIENGSMPLGGSKLPAAEINLIRQWIESL